MVEFKQRGELFEALKKLFWKGFLKDLKVIDMQDIIERILFYFFITL